MTLLPPELLERLRNGDRDAKDEAVILMQPHVLRMFLNRMGHNDAQDAAQNTILAALKIDGDWRNGEAVFWMIAGRRLVDHHRRSRPVTQALDENIPFAGSDSAKTAALRRALEKLPKDRSAVLKLYYFEGLSPCEIAKLLGVSLPCARSRLDRAKNQLRREMAS